MLSACWFQATLLSHVSGRERRGCTAWGVAEAHESGANLVDIAKHASSSTGKEHGDPQKF
jgi:hypothetical protein